MNKSLPPDLPKTKTVTFSAETEELDAVLSFVNAPLDALGVSEEEKIILDIAVEEIYVNIALYAYQPGRGPVTLRWTLEEDPLRIQIDFMDRGTPYDPLSRQDPDITLSAEERQIGGLGIYMVRKSMDKVSVFITKHYKVWIVAFLILLIPAIYGNNHTKIYYNIAQSLPQSLPSNVANSELKDDFDMSTMHIVMVDKDMDAKEKKAMMSEIDDVKGVKWTLGLNSIVGSSIPESMIPDDVKSMLQGKDTELMFVCTKYESATPQVNKQIKQIDKIVKSYDKSGMVIGEAPLMKDLQDVTDIDLTRVNVISIAAIFIIILLIFKSISLPIILVSVIEFAITINMAIPFYQGKSLPFVASIVIGAIQLGATVDYAILMTTRYQKERMKGKSKKESVAIAHRISMPSIITSGLSFFAATFGVTCYTQVDMIGSICELLSRGAIISVIVVLTVLPAMFLIFDPVICRTTAGYRVKKDKSKTVAEPTA